MSEFVPELLRLMVTAIRKPNHLANGRAPISLLPLRHSPPFERLPWDPGTIELTPDERQLLVWLWRELHQQLRPQKVMSESDVLYFALEQLQCFNRSSEVATAKMSS